MVSFQFWRNWLFVVSIFITVFGLVMAFLNATIVFAFFNQQINPAFWGSGPVPLPAQAFQAWVYGAWGSTVAGWGITLSFIAYYPFSRQERWSWNAVVVGLLVWFSIDTTFSWIFFVIINVLLNTTIFFLTIIPLIFTWKHMTSP